MSEVLWCDIGQHPFPMNQPGRTTLKLEQQIKNQWGGYQPHDVTQDVCSSCARDSGIRQIQMDIPQQTDDEANALADSIRDGTATSRFRSRLSAATKQLTNGDHKAKHITPDEARERGYDPDYVTWLENETSKPLPE